MCIIDTGSSSPQIFNHLKMIQNTIYPKVTPKNTIYGIVSKNKDILSLKCILLNNFKNKPNIIWITPTIIENFILKELVNEISLSD